MSSLPIYLHLLIAISAIVFSAPNLGLFLIKSAIDTFGQPELDQVWDASYNLLSAASPPSELPTDENWTDSPSAEPFYPQEIAVQPERLITNDNDVALQQAAGPTRGRDTKWHFNRPPPPQDSPNTCPNGFQPLGKRDVCSAALGDGLARPIQNPYSPNMNFLLTLPWNPPAEHREPCGLFSGAPRWAICDSADPKDRYPAGITIAKATLCMPLSFPLSPPPSKKE